MPKSLSSDLRSELSKRCKRERRDVRRLNVLRLVPAPRSNGCNVGVITGCVRRNRAAVADLLWNSMPSASLLSSTSNR
jgi:hypothetical protein